MAFPTYPATTLDQGVDLVIFSSNQLHDIINGDATATVETETGLIPTLRKALIDNFFFKSPIAWAAGTNETVFNQLRFFQNGILSGYYYAPTATTANPIPMQGTPSGDNNWVLWAMKTEQLANEVYPWLYTGATGYEKVISPPYVFDSAIVTINGVVQIVGDAYTIQDSQIILSEPLGLDPVTGLPNKLFAYIGKIVATADNDPNLVNRVTALENTTATLTTQMGKVPTQIVARKFGLKDSEVGTAQTGQTLTGIKALYDPVTQAAYTLPAGISGNYGSLSATGVLTYSGGTVDLAALAVERGQFVHLPTSFGNAATLTIKNQTIGMGSGRYRWAGTLPKTITASDTLESSGGVGPNAWVLTNTESLLTPHGGVFNDLFDVVYLSEFANNPKYTTPEAAFQAALTATANTKGKVLNAYGCDMTFTTSSFDITGITLKGGVFRGQRDYRLQNATLEGVTFRNARVMYWGGAVRIYDCLWDGAPRAGQVGSLVFQGNPITGTFEIDNCTFKNGLYGILQQGTGEPVTRGVFRNLTFMDMQGDAIELNVISKHYDDGCVIENIYLSNIDGTNAPIANSNWGIGIGVAGQGPYGYDIPDSQYCKNITIRNVFAKRCRQIVHVEVGRNITIENIHGDPDQTVSVGTGLATGAVVMYGSKDFTIDGVYGEPKTDANTLPSNIRMIYLEWGTNPVLGPDGQPVQPPQGRPSNPCFNYSVKNVHTRTGRVFAGVSAGPGFENRVSFENIRCAALQVFGIASWLSMANITCNSFECVGQPESGPGTFYDGFFRREKSVLEMVNVNCYSNGNTMVGGGRPAWSRCRYSDIHRVNCNVEANMYTNIAGGIGAILGSTGKVYYLEANPSRNIDGLHFPTGKEFDRGDMIVKADNTFFLVTTSGAYIPDIAAFGIRATTVGDKSLAQNLVPNGTATNASWLYHYPLSAGTRIRIPGAGAGGADLDTVITRAPYQDNDLWTNPVKIDIADPIQTATAAGIRIKTVPNDASNVAVGNTAVIRPTPNDVPTT